MKKKQYKCKTKIKIRTFDYEHDLLTDKQLIPENGRFNQEFDFECTDTIWNVFESSAEKYKDLKCMGIRRKDDSGSPADFVWETFAEVRHKVENLSKGLDLLLEELGPATPIENMEENDILQEEGEDKKAEEKEEETKNSDKINGETGNQNEAKQNAETHPNGDQMADETIMQNFEAYSKDANENIGIYSANRPEWMQTALAALSLNYKLVPLYDTFGAEAIEFIVRQSNIRVIVCSADKVDKLLDSKARHKLPSLRIIVQMDFDPTRNNKTDILTKETVSRAAFANVQLVGFSQVLKNGVQREAPFTPRRPSKDSLAYIMYTSGTSGLPKGVMLLHSSTVDIIKTGISRVKIEKGGSYLSYLPLAHIYETVIEIICFVAGAHIGYFSGDIRHIASDLKALRPDYFAAVPRVFEKMYSKIIKGVEEAPFYKRWLFRYALHKGVQRTHDASTLLEPKPLDRLVWAPLRAKLGFDRVRIVLLGGAPSAPHLLEFLRVFLRAAILQGYGLTETFAVVSLTHGSDTHLGHAGLPMGCQVRLLPLEESPSKHADLPTGEILVRGPNVFVGYFRDRARTREAFAGDWFRTGDVGRFNPNGTLSIVDRKKALFKLSQGEYISPEVLENAYGRSQAVNQIFVYGKSSRSFVVAVVVPEVSWVLKQLSDDPESVEAKSLLESGEFDVFKDRFRDLCNGHLSELKEALIGNLRNYEDAIKRFEVVRDIFIETDIDETLSGFSIGNDCLTPSFKLRRHALVKRYKCELEAMYSSNE